MKILALSPHLDDVILSAADHLLFSKQQGHEIDIVSIFTKFTSRAVSAAGKENMLKAGFENIRQYEKERKNEDIQAMRMLKVNWRHLNFIDGGFRTYNNQPMYKQTLFSGRISSDDLITQKKLSQKLFGYKNFDQIIIPLGVGRHIDHIITRNVAEQIFKGKQLLYYVDQPYGLYINNWGLTAVQRLILKKISMKLNSPTKLELLKCYRSQISFLLPKKIKYAECLFY